MNEFSNTIVSTGWLAEHLDSPDIRVVDASAYLPTENRDPRAEYAAEHIPNAVFFDLDDICDKASPLPHTLPSAEAFSAKVRKLGLGDGNRIVIYDGAGLFSAPRAWWMFKIFGHRDVVVLDGGLPKWKREGRPLTDSETLPRERHFTARLNTPMVRDKAQMLENLESKRAQVVDARSRDRFHARLPEPRPNMRSGHIPGSACVPISSLVDPKTGAMRTPEQLRALFEEAGVDLNRPIVTTCGSGVTAAGLILALTMLGCRNLALYDGSWTEWGGDPNTPIET